MNLASSNNLLLDAIFIYIAKLEYLIEVSVNLSVHIAILLRVFLYFQLLSCLFVVVPVLFFEVSNSDFPHL